MVQKRRSRKEREFGSAKKRAEAQEKGGQKIQITWPPGVKQFRFQKKGKYFIDIMPYVCGTGNPHCDEGMLYYERTFYIHRNVGPSKLGIVCPAMTAEKRCYICEYRDRLNWDDDEELMRALKTSQRQLFNLIDRKDKDAGIQVMEMSNWLFGKLLNEEITATDDEDLDRFFSYKKGEGKTLKLSAMPADVGTGYEVKNIVFLDRNGYKPEVVDKAACLDEMVPIPTYKELKELFLAGASSDDEDEDDTQATKGKKKKKKRRPDPDDLEDEDEDELDEDEEQDEDDDDDLEDDEDDEDEDEDEDDEDEDEDEPPKPKKKPRKKSRVKKKKSQDEDEDDEDVPF